MGQVPACSWTLPHLALERPKCPEWPKVDDLASFAILSFERARPVRGNVRIKSLHWVSSTVV